MRAIRSNAACSKYKKEVQWGPYRPQVGVSGLKATNETKCNLVAYIRVTQVFAETTTTKTRLSRGNIEPYEIS